MDQVLHRELPPDANLIKRVDPWAFYFAKSDCSLYVITTDYHPSPLKLSRDDLSEMLIIIENYRHDLETDVVRELENHLASIIEKEKDKEIFRNVKIKLVVPDK